MTKNKRIRKNRRQPRPKVKKHKIIPKDRIGFTMSVQDQLYTIGQGIMASLKDVDSVNIQMRAMIDKIEAYFRKYDSIQLMGGIGLYLLDNLSNPEKYFASQISGHPLTLDQDAEVMAEYAMNFGLSVPNDKVEHPTQDIILDLRESLRFLSKMYNILDIPQENIPDQFVDWIIRSKIISVRGDGYYQHIEEVFRELFDPHTNFYQQKYGFSVNELLNFLTHLEDRIICKVSDMNNVYGSYKMWQRWKEWDAEQNNGLVDDEMDGLLQRDYSKGIFGDFFEANPDVSHNGDQFILYPINDYTKSDKIFWVWPQNPTEKRIMDCLSLEFGSNASFITEGEFKGNILNGQKIYESPFVKDGDRFYCFTPMLPLRNLFLIAEKLMKCDDSYYQKNFQQNTKPISRDKYVERKVKDIFASFLPDATFYSSVQYKENDTGVEKINELDILGVSNNAIYIIEVKAHELSYKDCVGVKGAKEKFKESVTYGCYQCCRALKYINDNEPARFGNIEVDKCKPIYKIVVTFHHHASLFGNMDMLIKVGLMKDIYRDTWLVSLFDLMVIAEQIKSEIDFIKYLEMHKSIYSENSVFYDELDLLSGFLYDDLYEKVKTNKSRVIIGGTERIDEMYTDYLPLINGIT